MFPIELAFSVYIPLNIIDHTSTLILYIISLPHHRFRFINPSKMNIKHHKLLVIVCKDFAEFIDILIAIHD